MFLYLKIINLDKNFQVNLDACLNVTAQLSLSLLLLEFCFVFLLHVSRDKRWPYVQVMETLITQLSLPGQVRVASSTILRGKLAS